MAGFDAGTATETDDGLFKQTRDQDDAETTTEYGKTENGTDKTSYGKTERETGSKTFGEKIAEEKNGSHTLHMHGNIGVMSTQDMITQVLYNLIDNAVKFCPEGGTLGLKIKAGGNKAYISVSNEGETIPPEELPLVFDRFHKIDKSRSQNRDGWGLGLYIVKTIVCSHGEDISVTSRDGKTTFTFTMPLAKEY